MSLRASELAQVVAELDERLRGAVVQRAYSPAPGLAYLELRLPGQSVLLSLSAQPGLGRIGVAAARPPSPPTASALQQVLRKELGGARWVELRQEERTASLELEKQGKVRTLHLELEGTGALVLTDDLGRVLAVHAAKERGLKVGATYTPPPPPPCTLSVAPRAQSRRAPPADKPGRGESRLVPEPGSYFPYASAAERLFGARAQVTRAAEARRALLSPLRAKLARTARTLEKVRAEASRQPDAEAHRRFGELLSRNLHLVPRGAREVTLTEYSAQGAIERLVPLDPAQAPKAQAERHFHQYRRLLRGCEHAARRALELEAERARLSAEISRIESLPDEALARTDLPPAPPPKKAGPPVASPFREYRSARGERILVGKSAAGNDTLTFERAKPHDLWVHARGVPGSHVVVPHPKNTPLPQELLLDAAHLALHHSDSKGEPRGEVSYTQVKFVRRAKGGAPGQVTIAREKTLLVRIEPDRLRRLIQSAESPILKR